MSVLLNTATHIELAFEFNGQFSLVLNNRSCSVNTLSTSVPQYTKSADNIAWMRQHYHGNRVGINNRGRISYTPALDEINEHLDEDIHAMILNATQFNVAYDRKYVTGDGDFVVTVMLRTENALSCIDIKDEMRTSYLDYSMSVIIGRALPDIRDGLKPVHRRSLFAMSELNNTFRASYKKSARVVGDVIGKYHPHGDTAVYDTLVRLAQPFSMRYPLVEGQGNFGSIDGDGAAAMRYTEIRMQRITDMLIADMDCETVDYVPNYDGTEQIPEVFPTRIPNLLINGSSGIAVGMATNIPPHNLGEIINGCKALIYNRDISIDELMQHITGPDFPTGASINGVQGIRDAYHTGRGKIYLRGKAHIEECRNNRESIIVTEVPYQTNKARLIEKIAELVKNHKLEGISGLRDESDKDGMRIVIEVKRDAIAEVVLNNLYSNTQLQCTFGINMVALQNGQPKLFNLKEMLRAFINHRCEVVTRRTVFRLKKEIARVHLLEGFYVVHKNIDRVVNLIKQAKSRKDAIRSLMESGWQADKAVDIMQWDGELYQFSEVQASAIIDMRLYQLTEMEHNKIVDELELLSISINEYREILSNHNTLMDIIVNELDEIYDTFADNRLTNIMHSYHELQSEDMIENEQVVLTLSNAGYIKYQPVAEYNSQRRGGKGKSATKLRDDDFIKSLVVCNTHDTVLCFSSIGKVYWSKVHQLPSASRGSRGKPIINILPVENDETITAILPVSEFDENHFVMMATANGVVKKVALTNFSRPRSTGIIAIGLTDGDHLIGVDITDGKNEVMIFSDNGKVVRFDEAQVRAMGRTATGVRGIKLQEGAKVVSLVIPKPNCAILTATERGYGKQTMLDQYPAKNRGGQGVVSIKVSRRNGAVVGAVQVSIDDSIMLIANNGMIIRTEVTNLTTIGRNTSGVILMDIDKDSDIKLVGVSRVVDLEDIK